MCSSRNRNEDVCWDDHHILVVPDLASGNIFTKSLTFFAHLNSAGTLNGITHPVIMTSRTDTPEDKYYPILTAILKAV